jgi:glutamate/tyrosine decarboxylase-like PLP-dependent enzyme
MKVQGIATQKGSPLFPDAEERQRIDALLAASLDGLERRIAAAPVVPSLDHAAFRAELGAFDFETPQTPDMLLPWVIDRLEHGLVQITHPRYFGLFNPAPNHPALCADRIANAFNPQLASATTSPAAVAIEAHVIRAIAARAGMPQGSGGQFTSGGSEANNTALVCALTKAHAAFGREGARCFAGQPVFYVSRECHLAWIKIAHLAGIGRHAVRLVATDGSGRMSMPHLQRALEDDRASGCVPVMIVATAGTTNAGMVDPLQPCADLARAHDAWFHVDAAWGGALVASTRHRAALDGIHLADSMTIDAHKWFATTMGCGMFITRHANLLPIAFGVKNDFMPSHEADADPYVTSIQWSRRFMGLRMFLSLAAAGWQGYAAHVDRAIDLARQLKETLQSRGWGVANDSTMAVLCLEPPAGASDTATIARRVLASGVAWISTASFEGRPVIRACITHGQTSEDDIAQLADALEAAR